MTLIIYRRSNENSYFLGDTATTPNMRVYDRDARENNSARESNSNDQRLKVVSHQNGFTIAYATDDYLPVEEAFSEIGCDASFDTATEILRSKSKSGQADFIIAGHNGHASLKLSRGTINRCGDLEVLGNKLAFDAIENSNSSPFQFGQNQSSIELIGHERYDHDIEAFLSILNSGNFPDIGGIVCPFAITPHYTGYLSYKHSFGNPLELVIPENTRVLIPGIGSSAPDGTTNLRFYGGPWEFFAHYQENGKYLGRPSDLRNGKLELSEGIMTFEEIQEKPAQIRPGSVFATFP